jgi:diguanylate cyclase (GGDEF)-like protein
LPSPPIFSAQTLPDDPLAPERERLMYALSILAVAALLPFAVHNFLKARPLLGFAILSVVVPIAIDGWAIRARRKPPVPYALLLVPICATITLSLALQGVNGAFWCYPAVLFFFFVSSRVIANVCSAALLIVGTASVYYYITPRVTVRFAAALILTIFMINVIQTIVGDLHSRLVAQAITDPLTGAFNRRYMETRLFEAIESSRRRLGPVSLLILDIDHFKRVNDEHGHKVGDTVLQGVVALMRKRSRAVDLLFRMGGEEFVLLLADTGEPAALTVAEALRQAVADSPLLEGRTVTASIGVGETRPGDTVDSWLKDTDAALYAAKSGGRNRVARRGPARGAAIA